MLDLPKKPAILYVHTMALSFDTISTGGDQHIGKPCSIFATTLLYQLTLTRQVSISIMTSRQLGNISFLLSLELLTELHHSSIRNTMLQLILDNPGLEEHYWTPFTTGGIDLRHVSF